MTGILLTRSKFRQRHTGRSPGEDSSGDLSDTATHQEMPRVAGNHQKLRYEEEFFPEAFRGSSVLPAP